MTCVIGTRDFLCADRCISGDDGARWPSETKVWANHALVVAGAGVTGRLHRVRDATLAGATDMTRFIDMIGDDAQLLVLTPEGEFWEVVSGSRWPVKGLRCIGSGGDLARGYLEGKALTEQNARKAQQFVAKLRTDCGGGTDIKRKPCSASSKRTSPRSSSSRRSG
jgi:hypothetical protein